MYLKSGMANSKHIQSPNFPRNYPNNLDCLWMFVSSADSLLSANINLKYVSTAESRDKLIIQDSLQVSVQGDQAMEYYGTKATRYKTANNLQARVGNRKTMGTLYEGKF